MRVLIVDDESTIRRLIVRFLKSMDQKSEAIEAASHEEAMSKPGTFDFAVIDFDLGSDSGVEVAILLRRLHSRLNVVMMSGDPTNEKKTREAGLGHLLLKPFTLEDFRRRVIGINSHE